MGFYSLSQFWPSAVIETMVNEHSQNKERYREEYNAGTDVDAEEDGSGTDYLCIHRSKRCQFN
jgi:hypothetical protein